MNFEVKEPRGVLRLGRAVQIAVLIPTAAAALAIGYFYFVGPAVLVFRPDGIAAGSFPGFLLVAVAIWHPTVLALAGLWFLQSACGSFARGRWHAAPARRAVARSGIAFVASGVAAVTTKPLLLSSSAVAQIMTTLGLSYPVWSTRSADSLTSAFVIAAIGMMLVLLSAVMARGAAARDEVGQFF
jgi:hypothetical protein